MVKMYGEKMYFEMDLSHFQNMQTPTISQCRIVGENISTGSWPIKTIRATPDISQSIGVENIIQTIPTPTYSISLLYTACPKKSTKIINVQQHKKKQYGNNAV